MSVLSKVNDCREYLISLSKKAGYLTLDDILDASDTYNLSLPEVDILTEDLQIRGILVYETVPENIVYDDDLIDYSRTDYESIYAELVNMSASLRPLIEEIKAYPPPQYGETRSLAIQVQSGNSYARDRLICLHLRLALKIALSSTKEYELDVEDAVSAGFEGLITAVDKFDPNGFSSFLSYASMWIFQNIQRQCKPNWFNYYFPAHVQEGMMKVYLSYNGYNGTFNKSAGDNKELLSKIANDTQLALDKVEELIKLCYIQKIGKCVINNDFFCSNNMISSLPFLIYDDSVVTEQKELELGVEEVLGTLTSKEAYVLKMRYGIKKDHCYTLEEVGIELNVTRERIRQIEEKALRKIRKSNRAKKLIDYY